MYEEHYDQDGFTGEKYPQSIYHNEPQLKVMGDPTTLRRDAYPKVTGQGKFANDINLPNTLYLKFKVCPHSHCTVTSIDTSKAKALPGVVRVYTHDDVPELLSRPPYHYVLSRDCFMEGTEVAAVVAKDEDIADEAVDLIEVEYEVKPFILYAKEALEPGAPIIFGETNEIGDPWIMDRGDVDAGFAAADHVVEVETTSVTKPWSGDRTCAGIEPETLTASWEEERLKIWSATQNPHGDARTVAAQLGLPYNRVVTMPSYMGVGFGNKGTNNKAKILTGYAAHDTGQPVKCRQYTETSFNVGRSVQTAQNHSWRIGVNNDGTITTLEDINIQASGAWGGRGSTDSAKPLHFLYNIPNCHAVGRDVATNSNGTGVPRCVQHPQFAHGFGVALDQAAEVVNMDPADFILKNVNTKDRVGSSLQYPEWDMSSNPNPGLLQAVINNSGWKTKWKGWKTPMAVSGTKQKGIGIALQGCRHGYLSNPMSAMIKANNDGTWDLSCGSHDVGQGARTVLALIAAEEMGLPAEDVRMSYYQTATTQESVGTGGSRVTRGSGTAVIVACRDAKRQLFEMAIADGKIEADKPEDLETIDGNIYLKADPTVTVAVKEVTARQGRVYFERPDGSVGGYPIIGRGGYVTKRDRWMHIHWNGVVAEVEVDVDTGEVTVEKLTIVHDVGRVGWYKGLINQQYGGAIMSMGRVMYEGCIKDDATGVTLNPNYLDYKLPTHADIPEMPIELYEKFDWCGPMGVKGVGEPMCLGTAPAVANAVYNACGARINSTRLTPDKILAALGKA